MRLSMLRVMLLVFVTVAIRSAVYHPTLLFVGSLFAFLATASVISLALVKLMLSRDEASRLVVLATAIMAWPIVEWNLVLGGAILVLTTRPSAPVVIALAIAIFNVVGSSDLALQDLDESRDGSAMFWITGLLASLLVLDHAKLHADPQKKDQCPCRSRPSTSTSTFSRKS